MMLMALTYHGLCCVASISYLRSRTLVRIFVSFHCHMPYSQVRTFMQISVMCSTCISARVRTLIYPQPFWCRTYTTGYLGGTQQGSRTTSSDAAAAQNSLVPQATTVQNGAAQNGGMLGLARYWLSLNFMPFCFASWLFLATTVQIDWLSVSDDESSSSVPIIAIIPGSLLLHVQSSRPHVPHFCYCIQALVWT